jgi:hypothetical protein
MERVAVRLNRLLPEPHALIGGLAVGVHGYVRATKGVDFMVYADSKELRESLKQAGIETQLRRGDILEGDIPWVLFGQLEGVRFDILPPTVPVDWDRREYVRLGDEEVLVVDVSTLIRLKLRAGGSLDLIDVVQLVRGHPDERAKALEVARAYGLHERLERRLSESTLRSPEAPASKPASGRRPRRPSQ